jgi:phenylacetate-CoA ligase
MLFNLTFFLYHLQHLIRNQWRSPAELESIQLEKLKALVHHAYHNVTYYRRLFDQSGLKPEDIQSLQDLSKIPLTTRKTLQSLPQQEIIAKGVDLKRCLNLRTSGSTGMPLNIFVDSREVALRWLFYRRMYFANGGRLRDREARITTPRNFSAGKRFQSLGILRIKYLSVFDDIEVHLKIILQFKPNLIRSYVSNLKNLAYEISKRNIRELRPRIIFSTAEVLTKQDRDLIVSTFHSELFDYYACNECGIIAWECQEHSGYHIDCENAILEFIKEDGTRAESGEEGEIIVTVLDSYTMPFIRYKLQDIGIPSDEMCPCGKNLPLMKSIVGRSNDCIILPNGKKVSPFALMIAMDSISEVKTYQIIQEEKNKIKINVFQKQELGAKTIVKIKEKFKEILGENIEICPELVEAPAGGKKNKFRIIISKIEGND